MYYAYFFFIFIWIQERVPPQWDTHIFNDRSDPNFIDKYKSSISNLVFFNTLNFLINICSTAIFDINWIHFNINLFIYSATQIVYSYLYFKEIFLNVTVSFILIQIVICINNYSNIKVSKTNFLQDKKIKLLLK